MAIADVQDLSALAALFAVDSNYGRWPEPVCVDGNTLRVGERSIPYFNVKDGLPDWGKLEVDVVIECTGRAVTRAGAQPHLDRGARRVLASTVSKTQQDADAVLIPGINFDQFDPERHRIIAMGSCTPNALAHASPSPEAIVYVVEAARMGTQPSTP